MLKDLIEKMIDDLIEGDLPSSRPRKDVRSRLTRLREINSQLERLQQQADSIAQQMKPLESENETIASELKILLEDYQDRMARIKGVIARLEDIPPAKAKIPQWTKVIEFMLNKLGGISMDMRKEAEAFIETCKSIKPGRTDVDIEFEESTLTEGWFGRMISRIKAFASRSWNSIKELEQQMSKLSAPLSDDYFRNVPFSDESVLATSKPRVLSEVGRTPPAVAVVEVQHTIMDSDDNEVDVLATVEVTRLDKDDYEAEITSVGDLEEDRDMFDDLSTSDYDSITDRAIQMVIDDPSLFR